MDWFDAVKFCRAAQSQLNGLRQPLHEWASMPADFATEFAREDSAREEEVTAAIAHYSIEGRWPRLSPRAAELLHLRLAAAVHASETLMHSANWRREPGTPPADIGMTPAELLRWLTLTLWDDVGFAATVEILDRLKDAERPDRPGLN